MPHPVSMGRRLCEHPVLRRKTCRHPGRLPAPPLQASLSRGHQVISAPAREPRTRSGRSPCSSRGRSARIGLFCSPSCAPWLWRGGRQAVAVPLSQPHRQRPKRVTAWSRGRTFQGLLAASGLQRLRDHSKTSGAIPARGPRGDATFPSLPHCLLAQVKAMLPARAVVSCSSSGPPCFTGRGHHWGFHLCPQDQQGAGLCAT